MVFNTKEFSNISKITISDEADVALVQEFNKVCQSMGDKQKYLEKKQKEKDIKNQHSEIYARNLREYEQRLEQNKKEFDPDKWFKSSKKYNKK